jgi:hypothetical protein
MTLSHLRRRSLLLGGPVVPAIVPARANGQANWDAQPETSPVAEVQPVAMREGPHFVLGPTVTTLNYLNAYTVASDFGASTPASGRSISSTSAIGALSPWRKPNLRMRR